MRKVGIYLFCAIFTTICAGLFFLMGPSEKIKDGTVIDGINVGGMSYKKAINELEQNVPDLIIGTDGKKICSFMRIGTLDYKDVVIRAMREEDPGRPVVLWSDQELQSAINEFASTENKEKTGPENAYITWDKDNGSFQIIPEKEGDLIDPEKLYIAADHALRNESFVINDDVKKHANIKSTDLVLTDEMSWINELGDIVLDLEGAEERIQKSIWKNWISFDDDGIHVSRENMIDLVDSLKDRYDTIYLSRRFRTIHGDTIDIGGSKKDTFGYDMDAEATIEDLVASFQECRHPKIIWKSKGNGRGENDIGPVYAEVSIEDQHMWLIDHGNVVLDTDVVTGNIRNGGTTRGLFRILYKESPSVLRGDDYETHVSYWMPFTWTGTGFHDASWRGSFGGNIYTYNGSHGCVNMPVQKAKALYGIIDAGMPVVVY